MWKPITESAWLNCNDIQNGVLAKPIAVCAGVPGACPVAAPAFIGTGVKFFRF